MSINNDLLARSTKRSDKMEEIVFINRLKELIQQVKNQDLARIDYYDEETNRYCIIGLMATNSGIDKKTLIHAKQYDNNRADVDYSPDTDPFAKIAKQIEKYYGVDMQFILRLEKANVCWGKGAVLKLLEDRVALMMVEYARQKHP